MKDKICGVIGATSFVGSALLPRLVDSGYIIAAYSRGDSKSKGSNPSSSSILWNPKKIEISQWISLAPIWALNEMLPMMEKSRASKVVVLSTTSLFTKATSKHKYELKMVNKIEKAERTFIHWAETHGIDWVVLRPTLIYGLGKDRNISEIARLIKILGFFPLLGNGLGLRQPIHVDDVAYACQAALNRSDIRNCAYNISGGEILTYREMVSRVFSAMGKKRRLISIPRWMFLLALLVLKRFERFQTWSLTMVDRMNQDMVFDHAEAAKELGFEPRPFKLEKVDVP